MLKRISVAILAVISFGLATCSLRAQNQNVIAIRAGRLFDCKSNNLLNDQVIVIRGERISEVGPAASTSIPAGA
ncbi:MAG: amidohydrolase family protein, partial [Terriglobia bacterium]